MSLNTKEQTEKCYRNSLETVSRATFMDEGTKLEMEKMKLLHEQLVEEEKLELESRRHEQEMLMKRREDRAELVDHIIGHVLTAAGILVPVAMASHWMAQGLKFEETGTYTARTPSVIQGLLRLAGKK